MENPNTLVTVAMLAAVYNNEQKDYLDIIMPFVCNLLPPKNQVIDFLYVKQKMEDEYGFVDIPIGVLQRIAGRLCSLNPPICAYRSQEEYIICNAYNNSNFRTKRLEIKERFFDVANALSEYLRDERATDLTQSECETELLRFLDQCGHYILKRDKAARSLPVKERIGRYIACFIQTEKEARSAVYDKIIELARGYMVFRCIYFFTQSGCVNPKFTLNNVVIYLDTSLIINALGFDTQQGEHAVLDAIRLAKSLGARVTTLEHNNEEVQGILNAYIESYPRIQSFKLKELTLKGYSLLTLRSILEQVPTLIEKLLCEKSDKAPELGYSSDWYKLDAEEALSRYYFDSVQGKEKDIVAGTRIRNDVKTLSYVLGLRSGDRPKQFEKCKALVLSDSKTARQAVQVLYDDFERDEINLVYSLNDFSCLAWLASPSSASDIPEDILLYNATAALSASDQVIEEMLKQVDELEKVGEIGDEMAFILRTHPAVKEAVADISDKGTDVFSLETLNKICNAAVEKRAKEIASESYAQKIEFLTDQIAESASQNDILRQKISMQKMNEDARLSRMTDKAQNRASSVKNAIAKILCTFLRCLQILVIVIVIYSLTQDCKNAGSINVSVYRVIAGLFSIASIIDFFVPKMHLADRWIKKFANWCGDQVYHKEVIRGKEFLDL